MSRTWSSLDIQIGRLGYDFAFFDISLRPQCHMYSSLSSNEEALGFEFLELSQILFPRRLSETNSWDLYNLSRFSTSALWCSLVGRIPLATPGSFIAILYTLGLTTVPFLCHWLCFDVITVLRLLSLWLPPWPLPIRSSIICWNKLPTYLEADYCFLVARSLCKRELRIFFSLFCCFRVTVTVFILLLISEIMSVSCFIAALCRPCPQWIYRRWPTSEVLG